MAVQMNIMTCGYCGNKTTCHLKGGYTQVLTSTDDDYYITHWEILECPVCNGLILQQSYEDGCTPPYQVQAEKRVLYPAPNARLSNLPVEIAKEYEATLKVQSISSNACAVLARRTLEAIFVNEGATSGMLSQKIESLIKSASIPPLLADIAHIGRRIGNIGAHFDIGEATDEDVAVMLDFLKIILEYLYVIPAKVASVKARLLLRSSLVINYREERRQEKERNDAQTGESASSARCAGRTSDTQTGQELSCPSRLEISRANGGGKLGRQNAQ